MMTQPNWAAGPSQIRVAKTKQGRKKRGSSQEREPQSPCIRHDRNVNTGLRLQPGPKNFLAVRLPEKIVTERLLLSWPTEVDADEMFARYASDPEVTRYVRFLTHHSVEDTRAFIEEVNALRPAGTDFVWLVRERSTGILLGAIGVHAMPRAAVEIGYCYARDAWGRGIATEAACAVVEIVFGDEKIRRIFATCAPENAASARVLEKAGLAYECTLRRHVVLGNLDGEPHDAMRYGLVRNPLRKKKPSGGRCSRRVKHK